MKKGLMVAVIIFIIYIYATINPATHYFPRCPLLVITGFKCPGCGSQRALYCMLHGQWRQAFLYNPLLLICLPYIIIGLLKEYTTIFKGSFVFIQKWYGYWASIILFVVVIAYFILRNIFNF
jgi:Protein of unknown function (DUF2752)